MSAFRLGRGPVEGGALPAIIRRARWAGHAAIEVCADQGYAGRDVYQQLEQLGTVAFIPPQAHQAKRGIEAQAAGARCKTPVGVLAAIDRTTHGEGAISELKLQHALDRARCRGTQKLQIQALLDTSASRRVDAQERVQRPDRRRRQARWAAE